MLRKINGQRLLSLAVLAIVATSLFFLERRVEVLDSDQRVIGKVLPEIQRTETLGQTFVSHFSGLTRIDIIMATFKRRNTHAVTLRLNDVETGKDVATATVGPESIRDTQAHTTFRFPALPNSQNRTYRLTLESSSSEPGNSFTAWSSPQTIYAAGHLFISGASTEGSMAFRTFYERTANDMLTEFVSGFGWREARLVLGIVAALVIPGWFLLLVLMRDAPWDLTERLTVSIGISLAVVPIALLYSSTMGLRMTEGIAWILVSTMLFVCIIISTRRVAWRRKSVRSATGVGPTLAPITSSPIASFRQALADFDAFQLVPIALFVAAVYSRLMVLPWLSVPMWADSIHHTLITQLVIDRGIIPDSFEPYWPLSSVTYHTGYHTFLAFFHWLSGADAPLAVSLVGQLINAVAVLGSYLLAKRLTGDRWIGVFAGIIAGFLSIMPAYYANWGRYTQLAGHAILPVAIVVTMHAINSPQRSWRWVVAASITAGGLYLVHVRVLMFFAVFMLIFVIYLSLRHGRRDYIVAVWLRLAAVAFLGLALISPRLYESAGNLTRMISSPPGVSDQEWQTMMALYNGWGDLDKLVGFPTISLSLVAGVYVCVRKQFTVITLLLWVISLFAVASLSTDMLKLGALNNFTVLIALYIPCSIVGGYLLVGMYRAVRLRTRWAPLLATIVTSIVVVGGVGAQLSMMEPTYMLVTKNDESALEWIKTNVPSEAVFLANAVPDAVRPSLQGTDAGWWIRYSTGRQSTLPPMLYVAERTYDEGYADKLNRWYAALIPLLGTGKEFDLLRERGITHIYVGETGRGIDVGKLEESKNYEAIYRDGNIRVFRVLYG